MGVSRMFGAMAVVLVLSLVLLWLLLAAGVTLEPVAEWRAVIVANAEVALGAIAGWYWSKLNRPEPAS